MIKQKKIPMRKCVITNELCPKKDLLRVVKDPEGKVFFDYSGRANGHGAYVKNDVNVIELARKKGTLAKVLECEIPDEVYERLLKEASNASKN